METETLDTFKQGMIFLQFVKAVTTDAQFFLAKRGLHNIGDEMTFQSNSGFVFHDSRGFEAGGRGELDDVQAFISARSQEPEPKNQLHAIW